MNKAEFKENTFNAILRHGNSIIGPISLATLITFIVTYGIAFLVFVGIFAVGLTDLQAFSEPVTDPDEIKERFISMFGTAGTMIKALIIYYGILFFASIWIYSLLLHISKAKLEGAKPVFVTALNRSFGKNFWPMCFAGFLLLVGLFIFATLLSIVFILLRGNPGASVILLILGILAFILLSFRVMATFPAIVHGKMNALDAIRFSFKNITWRRAFVVFIVLIGVMIALGVVMALFMSLVAGSNLIPFLFMIIFSILIYTYTTSTLTALYYRFTEIEPEGEADAHLIT